MAELHDGNVTFLFTDIEGSTRLLKTLGGAYSEILAAQQRILRAAFAAHTGRRGTRGRKEVAEDDFRRGLRSATWASAG